MSLPGTQRHSARFPSPLVGVPVGERDSGAELVGVQSLRIARGVVWAEGQNDGFKSRVRFLYNFTEF